MQKKVYTISMIGQLKNGYYFLKVLVILSPAVLMSVLVMEKLLQTKIFHSIRSAINCEAHSVQTPSSIITAACGAGCSGIRINIGMI
ncbi:MAG: hypothetical protein ABI707_18770 [Ferruginibacter sp.]